MSKCRYYLKQSNPSRHHKSESSPFYKTQKLISSYIKLIMLCKAIPFISSQWGTQINPCKCCVFALNPVAAFLHAIKRPLKTSISVTFAFSEKGYDLFIPCGAFDPSSCFPDIFVRLQFSQNHCHLNEITRTCLKWYWIHIRQWELSGEVEHSIMMHLRKNDMKRMSKYF